MIKTLYVITLLFIALLYTQIIANYAKYFWVLIPALAFPPAAMLYLYWADFSTDFKPFVSDILLAGGMILPLLAVKFHPAGEYHPTWGDRTDGRRVRTLPAMAQVSPYIMVERNDGSNLFAESFEITRLERYVRQKRKEGLTNFGLIHILLAAYCRGLCKYPSLNRFLAGQKVYSRGDDIQFCMTIKKEMTTDSPDTIIKVHLKPTDTVLDVYNKVNEAVEKVKETPLDSNFDNTAAILTMIPGVLLKFVVGLLKLLDYFGMLPAFLLEISPFHGSVFFTSMGSLGIQPIYHHLYNFGNLPVFGSFGCKRRVTELDEEGNPVQRKYIDCKFVLDERIVDGFYYAAFFKYYKRLIYHPESLEMPPEQVCTDID